MSGSDMSTEPVFSGLKVVDIASYIAGPAAAAVLGDMGADVIKVEPPGLGDLQRYLGSVPPNPRAQANYAWHMTSRNKRGIVIDLKSTGGTKVLERLVRWADVLITNYPQAAREKLHLGYDEVAAWNPRLIYADITGFGDNGPDASLPGFDITAYWARSGLLASTRDAGAPPTVPVQGSGDYASAIALYGAIATGLYLRERTGSGAHVGTSLLAAGAWATATLIAGALAGGEFYGLHDRTDPPNPLINPYQSADGAWFMLVVAPPHWPGLARALGHSELLEDARFANPRDFGDGGRELAALLDAEFRSQPLEHWKQVLGAARVTYGLIQTPQEAAQDPQLHANGIVVPIADVGDGLAFTVDSPLSVYGRPKRPARRAPDPGEHTDEILAELGFTPDAVNDLRAEGTIPAAAGPEAAA
jgi:crotonobetainyl-CoA:carnitine CoA-transferase CaiB-like acyl-CoA transferase